jgi:hypothetical protein
LRLPGKIFGCNEETARKARIYTTIIVKPHRIPPEEQVARLYLAPRNHNRTGESSD